MHYSAQFHLLQQEFWFERAQLTPYSCVQLTFHARRQFEFTGRSIKIDAKKLYKKQIRNNVRSYAGIVCKLSKCLDLCNRNNVRWQKKNCVFLSSVNLVTTF